MNNCQSKRLIENRKFMESASSTIHVISKRHITFENRKCKWTSSGIKLQEEYMLYLDDDNNKTIHLESK